jgi:hypothetical protein
MRPGYVNSRTRTRTRTIIRTRTKDDRSGASAPSAKRLFQLSCERIKLARKDLLKRSLALPAAKVATGEGDLGDRSDKQADKTQTPFHVLACPFVPSSIPGAGLERLRPSSWLSHAQRLFARSIANHLGTRRTLVDRSDGGPPMHGLASLQIHRQSPPARKTSPNARSQHKSSCSAWLPTLTNHVPGTGQLSQADKRRPFNI